MISIKINNLKFLVKPEISILEACKYIGITIPRFCYHEILSVAGNCRMCLVELENVEKPIASCVTLVENGMSIYSNTPFVKKARENVIETLLLNHPLDCPICDQAGECDLQDQTKNFGGNYTRFFFKKRGVEDKNCGPLIKTIMTRCIHCTRCVRFSSEIAGVDFLITLNRGTSTEIGSYISQMFSSEISGNVIDLCPVGALTSKPYAFKTRPWELKLNESIDTSDSFGSNIYVNFKETEIFRILPKSNNSLNENIISDKTRFSYDSVKNNRIKNLFQLNDSNLKFSIQNWNNFFQKTDLLFKTNNSINIFINDELDLKTVEFLKKLSNKYSNKIKIKCLSKTQIKSSNNFYKQGTTDVINDINSSDICFLISTNPRLESAILNAKLRFKFKNSIFSIFSLGQTFTENIPTTFLNLNIKDFLETLEGKNNLCKSIITSQKPLFILGESLKSSIINIDFIISFIKFKFNYVKIIKINSSCNTEGINLLNIKTINTKNLLKSENTIFINLDDTIKIRKFIKKFDLSCIWLNTHGSKIATTSKLIIPTLTSFEEEQIFLNLEQRPQKTQKTFSNFFNSRSVINIFSSILNLKKNELKNTSNYLGYIYEILDNSEKFIIPNKNFFFKENYANTYEFVFLYPLKSKIEDFYCSNLFTKNSLVMQQCSQIKRNISTNFLN